MTKLKIGALVALVSSILLNVWLLTRPRPVPEIKTVEKVVTVDRVVVEEKEVIKTVTKPDGTKIVTETKTKTDEKVKVSDKSKETVIAKKTRYSLGLEVGRPLGLDILTASNVYRAELGYRLGDSPLWATVTLGTDKTVLVGIRLEF